MAGPTKEESSEDEAYWLSVIAKGLAYICLNSAELKDADIGTKGDLLGSLGLRRSHIASILNTTQETVRVSMRKSKRSGRTNRGKGEARSK